MFCINFVCFCFFAEDHFGSFLFIHFSFCKQFITSICLMDLAWTIVCPLLALWANYNFNFLLNGCVGHVRALNCLCYCSPVVICASLLINNKARDLSKRFVFCIQYCTKTYCMEILHKFAW